MARLPIFLLSLTSLLCSATATSLHSEIIRTPALDSAGYTLLKEHAFAFTNPSDNEEAAHIIPIQAQTGTSPSQKYVRMLTSPNDGIGNAPVKGIGDSVYTTTITLGDQPFQVVLDTGSSDTWLISSSFSCNYPAPRSCKFGAGYKPTPSFSTVLNRRLDVTYASDETLQGIFGRENVSVGGVVVKNQTVGIAQTGRWNGDGITSGLMGLAFPKGTRAYEGENRVPYDPIITNMYKQGAAKPIFSLALNKPGEAEGVLALGGLPGPSIKHSDTWARSKMEYYKMFGQGPGTEYLFYACKAQGWTINDRDTRQEIEVRIDSGAKTSYFPYEFANTVNNLWQPKATNSPRQGGYLVPCDSKPPKFGIIINGTKLMFEGETVPMIPGVGGLPGQCMSSIQTGTARSSYILGSQFLISVVAVFDVGGAEMRFAQRIR